jgi:hypothetical protein
LIYFGGINNECDMKKIIPMVLLCLISFSFWGFYAVGPAQFPEMMDLYESHNRYKEPLLKERRFKHADIVPLLNILPAAYRLRVLGKSVEGRNIYSVTMGNGPVAVLLWSQMHGDEPTATMALFDIFRFMQRHDEFDSFRDKLLSKLTIHVVPMLNPDGAERYTRRNVQDIDINRDAQRLQTPEGNILKAIRDSVQADWGFNLHDQSRYYSAGNVPKTAAISFLAPAFDEAKTMSEKRSDAARLIGVMNKTIQEIIPGSVGKYDDTFEPRAFGDNIQKWGTRTILIETGALPGDPEKQALRRINYTAILTALSAIADESYKQMPISEYDGIPFNNSNAFHDLMLREILLPTLKGKYFISDLAYRNDEVQLADNRTFYLSSKISELGDLSTFFAYNDKPLKGYKAKMGKIYPAVLSDVAAVKNLDVASLLKQGITYIQVANVKKSKEMMNFPLHIIQPNTSVPTEFKIGLNPSFVLEKEDKIQYAVINGTLYDLANLPSGN